MLNFDEYQQLCRLIESNPELEPIVNNMSSFSLSELSIDSHDIKNYIAYMKTTFQLLKKKSPEICDNPYFNRMEKVISQLIYHMERTTLYRYSMKKTEKEPISINNIMYEIPDIIDDTLNNSCDFSFCLDETPDILINPEQLKTLITEAVLNACEASECSGEITLITKKDDNGILVQIVNNRIIPDCNQSGTSPLDYNQLIKPFFSTKKEHVGVGLSIIHQICLSNNAKADIYEHEGKTVLSILFQQ
ncbi:MAG: hypothetical protein Q4E78_10005 [Eubacteriales bacterium]|nr:hypothetical protein [Eubacteriales bacterium]